MPSLFSLSFILSKPEDQQVAELAQQSLTDFVQTLASSCLDSVQTRFKREACHLESVMLVRALDKMSGKLQAMDRLLPSAGFKE